MANLIYYYAKELAIYVLKNHMFAGLPLMLTTEWYTSILQQ